MLPWANFEYGLWSNLDLAGGTHGNLAHFCPLLKKVVATSQAARPMPTP